MTAAPVINGTVHLQVTPQTALAEDDAAELRTIVEQFHEALRLHVLPGTLGSVHSFEQSTDGAVTARFDVSDVEPYAFRVLKGMLGYFSFMVAPLGLVAAWIETPSRPITVDLHAPTTKLDAEDDHPAEPSGPNLLTTDAPLPVAGSDLPFTVDLSLRSGAAPPLVVEVVFADELDDEDKDRLERELRVWVALVHGGYPRPGDPPGSSAIGPLTIRYDDAQTLRLSADAFFAGDECFASLQALLLHWHETTPVLSLETE